MGGSTSRAGRQSNPAPVANRRRIPLYSPDRPIPSIEAEPLAPSQLRPSRSPSRSLSLNSCNRQLLVQASGRSRSFASGDFSDPELPADPPRRQSLLSRVVQPEDVVEQAPEETAEQPSEDAAERPRQRVKLPPLPSPLGSSVERLLGLRTASESLDLSLGTSRARAGIARSRVLADEDGSSAVVTRPRSHQHHPGGGIGDV